MKAQKGFTLIELIMVIVILGILAATALPKFVNLSGDADAAALKGVAGALSSGTSIRYAQRQISSGSATAVTTCTLAADTLTGGTLTTGYEFVDGTVGCASGANATCVLRKIGTTTPTISAVITCS